MRLLILLLVFGAKISLAANFFGNLEQNTTKVDISHLIKNIIYDKNEKINILHNYGNDFILLGSKNRAYNISLKTMQEIDRFEWEPNENAKINCAAISLDAQIVCHNFIRTFFELANGFFILCGTYALQPTCAEFRIGNSSATRLIPSIGMSPVDADSISPFIRSNDNIITVNVAELSSSEPLLIRRNVMKMWKGVENDVILRTPRGLNSFEQQTSFLGMFKEKNEKEVLFFFSESPIDSEGCGLGLHKVARIGRICDDDMGGNSGQLSKEWSSYTKARLECSIEEENEDTFYFNQFASVSQSRNYFYGAFRSQLAGIGASAICRYEKKYISQTIANSFRNSRESCPRAMDLEELLKIRVNPLIKQKISAHPIYVFHGKDKFVNMITDENVRDLSGKSFDIMYIATNLGNILKVVLPHSGGGQARHSSTLRVLPPNTKIISMQLFTENLANNLTYQYLILITDHSVLKIPTTTCNLAPNCAECLSSGDPQCAWADAGECIDVRSEKTRIKYSSQDSGTCDLNFGQEIKPISLAPLKPVKKEPLNCLCETTTVIPCTTEVIQKEIIQYATSSEIWKYLAIFAAGLVVGAVFNCIYFYLNRRFCQQNRENLKGGGGLSSRSSTAIAPTRMPIDAFTNSTIADEMFSMHSSIRTYC
ncbi:unnamed protein product [Caenorhabditis angaria]|uniref:Sema domain-containing protein n=1 Tax=Caenorhabditis angaria TaxID=860376 RepID=A0A9P1MWP6_9PELO|nr:unnamed protein product [Caenorhabditis angaria]